MFLRFAHFHCQKKLIAVDVHSVIGFQQDGNATILLVTRLDQNEPQNLHVDESFQECYARLNEIEPFEFDAKVPRN